MRLEISRRGVQFLAPESLCSPSYEGLKVHVSHSTIDVRLLHNVYLFHNVTAAHNSFYICHGGPAPYDYNICNIRNYVCRAPKLSALVQYTELYMPELLWFEGDART